MRGRTGGTAWQLCALAALAFLFAQVEPQAVPPVGIDLCACQPAIYEITLSFDVSCDESNVSGPGIAEIACVEARETEDDVTDFRPELITDIQFLELNRDLATLQQEPRDGPFRDGDVVTYSSVLNVFTEFNETSLPRAFQMVLRGFNSIDQPIQVTWVVTYANDCGLFPILTVGQQMGWSIFTDLGDPPVFVCPLAASEAPSEAPTDTMSPTRVDTQRTSAPTSSPTNAPSSGSTNAPTTVRCPPVKEYKGKGKGKGKGYVYSAKSSKSSKGSYKGKGKGNLYSSKSSKSSYEGKGKGYVYSAKSSKSSKGSYKGKGKGNLYSSKSSKSSYEGKGKGVSSKSPKSSFKGKGKGYISESSKSSSGKGGKGGSSSSSSKSYGGKMGMSLHKKKNSGKGYMQKRRTLYDFVGGLFQGIEENDLDEDESWEQEDDLEDHEELAAYYPERNVLSITGYGLPMSIAGKMSYSSSSSSSKSSGKMSYSSSSSSSSSKSSGKMSYSTKSSSSKSSGKMSYSSSSSSSSKSYGKMSYGSKSPGKVYAHHPPEPHFEGCPEPEPEPEPSPKGKGKGYVTSFKGKGGSVKAGKSSESSSKSSKSSKASKSMIYVKKMTYYSKSVKSSGKGKGGKGSMMHLKGGKGHY